MQNVVAPQNLLILESCGYSEYAVGTQNLWVLKKDVFKTKSYSKCRNSEVQIVKRCGYSKLWIFKIVGTKNCGYAKV